jgi:hypothetical protein
MILLLDELLGGFRGPRIRFVGDMRWAVEEEDFTDLMLEYEARATSSTLNTGTS